MITLAQRMVLDPDSGKRDPPRALKLAQEAVQLERCALARSAIS
jgi:hypothetical protein